MQVRAALPLLLLLAGCETRKAPCPPPGSGAAAAVAPGTPEWQDDITDADHLRLRAWRESLVAALAEARADGHGAEIDRAGALLDPDVALDDAALPPGAYRCSVTKIGAKTPGEGHVTFIRYPAHRCEVRADAPLARFKEQDGLQRPIGRLYPDTPSRLVFLGTMVLGDEKKPIGYGRDADRDMVGAVQRIGDKRWRMLIPKPAWESQMDVMELVPAG